MQSSRSEPLPPEIAEDSAAKKQKQEPEKSKEMQGLCRKPTQEKQGQQIQESETKRETRIWMFREPERDERQAFR